MRDYRPDIQGIRAMAVLAVVLYHAKIPGFSGGYVGVDVFFVISGYLITGQLIRQERVDAKTAFLAFYARRIKRLVPALALMLTITGVASTFLLPEIQWSLTNRSAIYAAVFASNLFFTGQAQDYLAGDFASNPFLHTWSLGVEFQYYVFWPIVLYAIYWSSPCLTWRPSILLWLLAFLSLAAAEAMLQSHQGLSYFSTISRSWEFIVGAMISRVDRAAPKLNKKCLEALSLLGLFAIVLAISHFEAHTAFPGVNALLPVLGAACLIYSGGRTFLARRVLATRPLVWVGDVSYSWYLWHWPIITFVFLRSENRSGLFLAALVAITFGTAWISYHGLERRIGRRIGYWSTPGKCFITGATMTLATLVVLFSVALVDGKISKSAFNKRLKGAALTLVETYGNGCHADYFKVSIDPCVYGDVASKRTVYLLGDSHAAQWLPPLHAIALRKHIRLVVRTKSACPIANMIPFNTALGREYTECKTWRDAVIQEIRNEKPQAVMIGNSDGHMDPGTNSGLPEKPWRQALEEAIRAFPETTEILLISDTPWHRAKIPLCLSKYKNESEAGGKCDTPRHEAVHALARATDIEMAGSVRSNVRVIDMTDHICSETTCPAMIDDVITYQDADHLSVAFSKALESVLEVKLIEAGMREP